MLKCTKMRRAASLLARIPTRRGLRDVQWSAKQPATSQVPGRLTDCAHNGKTAHSQMMDADGTSWDCNPQEDATAHDLFEAGHNIYWSPGDVNEDVSFMGMQADDIHGTCVCARTTYSLVPGAEALNLELDHTFLLPTQVT